MGMLRPSSHPDAAASPFSGLIARTLTGVLPGGRLPRLERVVIAVFPLKDVPVERLQHLIEKTVHGPAREISEIGAFPRHDVEHLRKLAVARDVRRIELEPIGSLARAGLRGGGGTSLRAGGAAGLAWRSARARRLVAGRRSRARPARRGSRRSGRSARRSGSRRWRARAPGRV